MVLTTHGIVGAATASLFPGHPVFGILAAFASHYILDSFPHWDYSIQSFKRDTDNSFNGEFIIGPQSFVDLVKIGLDFTSGMILSLIFLTPMSPMPLGLVLIIGGASAGMLPDLLQFVYFRFKPSWLLPLQRLHYFFHSQTKIRYNHLLGAAIQVTIVLAVILIVYYS